MAKTKLEQPDFSQAMRDIKKMLLATHKITMTKEGYDYQGVEIEHRSILSNSLNIKQSVTPRMLKYDREEQNRSFLDIILAKVFQLGYSSAQIQRDNEIQVTNFSDEQMEMLLKSIEKEK